MRRTLLLTLTATLASTASAVTFTIGYQKGGLPNLLKARGTLDAYAKQGIDFRWSLFTAGPPLLEAANAGAVDFGSVGDAPGVFALAGGAALQYVAVSDRKSLDSEAIIVPRTSTLKTVADLRGKRVGVARGSSAHAFLQNALKTAKLGLGDITLVPLLPPDARAAFESGAIDAWAVWDPYLTTALQATGARVLRDHRGLPRSNSYYLAPSAVLKDADKKRALQIVLAELEATAAWANTHQDDVIRQFSDELGIPQSVLNVTVRKEVPFNIRPFRSTDIRPLQGLADTFRDVGVLPRALKLNAASYVTLPNFSAALRALGVK
ncbi:aliphatic sulfonate ABC transporter substrate-binding protein [Deinococcus maricopensis]|uniref:Putative aliphatic sulfonates-binding protein n=1 Tax=Deinococcus maricopensis (strain DSM 21211 / LMG 22137 / NRRL B-23946 / LB-34) TaxID=709986 RepID=E8U423_DEIML|nr:aliphatic sulfonate ABC transporter substrate-binding protein [Deinococcus maricopensis]ADV65860.1 aliphatic sulfonates family ABC transporter, periplasmic ligand-binding protein [Deinococcus maricopensis DSM 21211]